jgi:hypothetical protein
MTKGADQHRQQHAGERGLHHLGREQAMAAGQRQQHEAELAGLRQLRRGAEGDRRVGAGEARDDDHQQALAGHQPEQDQEHPLEALPHHGGVELGADGDEEQAEQHVAEGADVGLHLVAVHGLRNQHAAEEGAQRQRQAGPLGEEGQRRW